MAGIVQVDAPGKQRVEHADISATLSGEWLGNMIPPEPTRMDCVVAAIWPLTISGEEHARLAAL
jgi:hypothetical protein